MITPKQSTREKPEARTEMKPAVESFYLPEYKVTVEATSKKEAIKKAKQLKEEQ